MASGRADFRWATKTGASVAFCLLGAIAGAVLYLANLTYVKAGDDAAKAASARQAAATLPSGAPISQDCNPVASFRPPPTMPAPGAMPSGSTMARIQTRGYLIVGVAQDTNLFGHLNTNDNQTEGFDIDIAAAVATAIFGSPTGHLELKAITAAERIPVLMNGEVDIVVDTMTETCDRWQEIDFSTEYYAAAQRVLVDKKSHYQSLNDLGDKWVCATTGSTSLATIIHATSHPVPVAAQSYTDCLLRLERGEIDAISTDDSILAGLAAQDSHTHIVGPALNTSPYGIGIGKSAPDLVRFVNGVLDQLRAKGGWTAIYHKWLGRLGGPTPQPPPAVYLTDSPSP